MPVDEKEELEPEAQEPEKPKKTRKRKKPAAKEVEAETPDETPDEAPEPEPEKAPEMEPAEAKKQAIDILIELYNENRQADVKKLLTEFGVKKFGEVPDEKGNDLLAKATDLQKEAA
jgi:hypothetical protein